MSKFDLIFVSKLEQGKRYQILPINPDDQEEERIVFIPNDWTGVIERNEDGSGKLKVEWIDKSITLVFEDDKHLKEIIENLT